MWIILLYVYQWHIRWRWWLIRLCGGWRGQRRWNLRRLDEGRRTSWKGERSPPVDQIWTLVVASLCERAKKKIPFQQQKCGVDKRECCLQEIRQTEEKYSETLEAVIQVCTWREHFSDILPTTHAHVQICLHTFAALYETSWTVSPASRLWEHLHQHRGTEETLCMCLCMSLCQRVDFCFRIWPTSTVIYWGRCGPPSSIMAAGTFTRCFLTIKRGTDTGIVLLNSLLNSASSKLAWKHKTFAFSWDEIETPG